MGRSRVAHLARARPPPPPPPHSQLTDDAQCAAKSARVGQALQPFATRAANLAAWCDAQGPGAGAAHAARWGLSPPPPPPAGCDPAHPYRGRFSVHELHDAFGASVSDASYTAIVCSEETVPGCELVNERRAALGWPPMQLAVVPLLADAATGAKLSSTRLRAAAAPPAPQPTEPPPSDLEARRGGDSGLSTSSRDVGSSEASASASVNDIDRSISRSRSRRCTRYCKHASACCMRSASAAAGTGIPYACMHA